MTNWIESMTTPESNFNESQALNGTDVTVYPEPFHSIETKKRRLEDGTMDVVGQPASTTYARLPSQMVANQHLVKVHNEIKKECEELVQLIVRKVSAFCLAPSCAYSDQDKIKLWVNLTMPKWALLFVYILYRG